MELAKLTTKGQITLPIAIRRALFLKEGDKVAFVEKDGQYVILNSTKLAFEGIQEAMKDEADRLGLKDIDDVVALIKEVRAEKRGQ